mmetsp:Transcript_26328/g.84733  ORF Transcript_26328/g.84733 Transcript_26328/m.84733 type:complete len:426 (+) Transcript_26328:1529-2806(+)
MAPVAGHRVLRTARLFSGARGRLLRGRHSSLRGAQRLGRLPLGLLRPLLVVDLHDRLDGRRVRPGRLRLGTWRRPRFGAVRPAQRRARQTHGVVRCRRRAGHGLGEAARLDPAPPVALRLQVRLAKVQHADRHPFLAQNATDGSLLGASLVVVAAAAASPAAPLLLDALQEGQLALLACAVHHRGQVLRARRVLAAHVEPGHALRALHDHRLQRGHGQLHDGAHEVAAVRRRSGLQASQLRRRRQRQGRMRACSCITQCRLHQRAGQIDASGSVRARDPCGEARVPVHCHAAAVQRVHELQLRTARPVEARHLDAKRLQQIGWHALDAAAPALARRRGEGLGEHAGAHQLALVRSEPDAGAEPSHSCLDVHAEPPRLDHGPHAQLHVVERGAQHCIMLRTLDEHRVPVARAERVHILLAHLLRVH